MAPSIMDSHLPRREEIELAVRTPLPPSVSTLGFYNLDRSETLQDVADGSSNLDASTLPLDRSSGGPDQALAPADGGFKAWSFVRN